MRVRQPRSQGTQQCRSALAPGSGGTAQPSSFQPEHDDLIARVGSSGNAAGALQDANAPATATACVVKHSPLSTAAFKTSISSLADPGGFALTHRACAGCACPPDGRGDNALAAVHVCHGPFSMEDASAAQPTASSTAPQLVPHQAIFTSSMRASVAPASDSQGSDQSGGRHDAQWAASDAVLFSRSASTRSAERPAKSAPLSDSEASAMLVATGPRASAFGSIASSSFMQGRSLVAAASFDRSFTVDSHQAGHFQMPQRTDMAQLRLAEEAGGAHEYAGEQLAGDSPYVSSGVGGQSGKLVDAVGHPLAPAVAATAASRAGAASARASPPASPISVATQSDSSALRRNVQGSLSELSSIGRSSAQLHTAAQGSSSSLLAAPSPARHADPFVMSADDSVNPAATPERAKYGAAHVLHSSELEHNDSMAGGKHSGVGCSQQSAAGSHPPDHSMADVSSSIAACSHEAPDADSMVHVAMPSAAGLADMHPSNAHAPFTVEQVAASTNQPERLGTHAAQHSGTHRSERSTSESWKHFINDTDVETEAVRQLNNEMGMSFLSAESNRIASSAGSALNMQQSWSRLCLPPARATLTNVQRSTPHPAHGQPPAARGVQQQSPVHQSKAGLPSHDTILQQPSMLAVPPTPPDSTCDTSSDAAPSAGPSSLSSLIPTPCSQQGISGRAVSVVRGSTDEASSWLAQAGAFSNSANVAAPASASAALKRGRAPPEEDEAWLPSSPSFASEVRGKRASKAAIMHDRHCRSINCKCRGSKPASAQQGTDGGRSSTHSSHQCHAQHNALSANLPSSRSTASGAWATPCAHEDAASESPVSSAVAAAATGRHAQVEEQQPAAHVPALANALSASKEQQAESVSMQATAGIVSPTTPAVTTSTGNSVRPSTGSVASAHLPPRAVARAEQYMPPAPGARSGLRTTTESIPEAAAATHPSNTVQSQSSQMTALAAQQSSVHLRTGSGVSIISRGGAVQSDASVQFVQPDAMGPWQQPAVSQPASVTSRTQSSRHSSTQLALEASDRESSVPQQMMQPPSRIPQPPRSTGSVTSDRQRAGSRNALYQHQARDPVQPSSRLEGARVQRRSSGAVSPADAELYFGTEPACVEPGSVHGAFVSQGLLCSRLRWCE